MGPGLCEQPTPLGWPQSGFHRKEPSMSMTSNPPESKPSTYLLLQAMHAYCNDPRRVHRAMAILDREDEASHPDDFEELSEELLTPELGRDDDGEFVRVPEPWEPFQPTEADLADYCQWSASLDRGPTDADIDEAHRFAIWQDLVERERRLSDDDLVAAGLPVG